MLDGFLLDGSLLFVYQHRQGKNERLSLVGVERCIGLCRLSVLLKLAVPRLQLAIGIVKLCQRRLGAALPMRLLGVTYSAVLHVASSLES